jgi:predicted nucleotidyltransferase
MAADTRLGDQLNSAGNTALHPTPPAIPPVPWLDNDTSAYLRLIVAEIAQQRPEAVAAILFGSVARREERPLDDPHPSDVDLLILFAPRPGQEDVTGEQHHAISWAVVHSLDAYPDPPREVQVVGALTHFARWDPMFVENVARDGLLLWARGPLPPALSHLPHLESAASARPHS